MNLAQSNPEMTEKLNSELQALLGPGKKQVEFFSLLFSNLAVLRLYTLITVSLFLAGCDDQGDQPSYLIELNGNALVQPGQLKYSPIKPSIAKI